ncbi:MAG: hypothetical protein K8R67_17430 [Desulfobacteraceae bacterium]|nr:hypothetical protein [Desulfobacteraceae bacterium]
MKTTKLVMITALVSFALMSFATTELAMSKNVISLKAAMQNTELVRAMYCQINAEDFLRSERSGLFTAQVVLKKTVYLINGTYAEWKYFFHIETDGKPNDEASKQLLPYFKENPFSLSNKKVKGKKTIKSLVDKP